MEDRTRALLAVTLVGFVPTLSILFTLKYNDDELTSQAFFMACKLWIFAVPTYWFLKIEGNQISWSIPERDGLIMGVISGSVMTTIILAVWVLLGDTIDTGAMISEMESTGLTDIRIYIAGMLYWIFLNSMLEEYVFRWFITTKGIEIFGSEIGGILLSSCMFTLHHSIALHLLGFVWWQTAVASFGLLSAAAIWSWLYVRYKSIWVCWLSHAICDVAVFGIGYLLVFG
tara:strand:+ start:2816 stop:3502 length:687 start_codon:yes stop_codon:yes gene_type:complete